MKQIDIDEDIYAYLAAKTIRIGESASDILRRLLDLPKNIVETSPAVPQDHEFSKLLSDARIVLRPATSKYLSILAEAYKQKSNDFAKLLDVRGRERIYFAKSEQEILASGSSTHPKQIPGTPYWAMTNASNDKKAAILEQALASIGFSPQACEAVGKALR